MSGHPFVIAGCFDPDFARCGANRKQTRGPTRDIGQIDVFRIRIEVGPLDRLQINQVVDQL
ncbi:hypothetical protein D3C83_186950 [compost metagenome]